MSVTHVFGDCCMLQADGTFPSTTKTLQDKGNLTIVNLGKEDYGTFECVATNIVTSVITTSLLIIECMYFTGCFLMCTTHYRLGLPTVVLGRVQQSSYLKN